MSNRIIPCPTIPECWDIVDSEGNLVNHLGSNSMTTYEKGQYVQYRKAGLWWDGRIADTTEDQVYIQSLSHPYHARWFFLDKVRPMPKQDVPPSSEQVWEYKIVGTAIALPAEELDKYVGWELAAVVTGWNGWEYIFKRPKK